MKKFAAILLSLVLTLTVALADSIYVVSVRTAPARAPRSSN